MTPGESWSFSNPGPAGGGGEISPGEGSTGFNAGRVVFANSSGQLVNPDTALYWDTTAKRLGIGTTAPTAALHVTGAANVGTPLTGVGSLNIRSAAGSALTLGIAGVGDVINLAPTGGSSHTIAIGTSNGLSRLGFFSTSTAAGTTQPTTYTTAAITSARVWPSTASISTFTGMTGSGAAFTSRADLEALVQVVHNMYLDLRDLGLLR